MRESFQPFQHNYNDPFVKNINGPHYFQLLSKLPQYRDVQKKLSLKLSHFKDCSIDRHAEIMDETCIKYEGGWGKWNKFHDVLFEIDYDEKTDDRIDLRAILCDWPDENSDVLNDGKEDQDDDKEKDKVPDESIKRYPSIFALFAIQSEWFRNKMCEFYNAMEKDIQNKSKQRTNSNSAAFSYGRKKIQ